jgi:L-alanine-DL-glutamate epimerase-like enolase superfamily enzyme
MHSRPALFVRIEESEGAFGFGEVWCNFPSCGADHRARLLAEELAPLALAGTFQHPTELIQRLSGKVRIRALQSGEPGPYAQAIAGLDIAMWDLFARKAGLPVRRLLSPDAADSVPAYASGIHIRRAEDMLTKARAEGYLAFKVKVGFDLPDDIARTCQLAAGLRGGERLFADANQAWTLTEAIRFAKGVVDTGLGWIEEPLAADAPPDEWRSLADASPIPLAAGENIAGLDAFAEVVESAFLAIIQPDLAKWGGFSGCFQVARAALAAGRLFCPHYLGGGIGLLASAHLLAAAGGAGLLEIDVNDNPTRQEIWNPVLEAGRIPLGTSVGLGTERLPDRLLQLTEYYREVTASGPTHTGSP